MRVMAARISQDDQRRRRARRLRSIAVVCSLFVGLAGGMVTFEPPASAAAEGVATSVEKAIALARTNHAPVVVSSLLTETTRVTANPDGSLTAEVHSGPVRFKDSTGAWRDVDLTLERRPDGTVAPRAHPRGLVFTGSQSDGDHDLATAKNGAATAVLGWDGPLPDPMISGTKATYPDVLAGIDLVLDATRTGFEEYLVVKSQDAASQVENLVLPWRGKNATPVSDGVGGLDLRDRNGRTVAHVPGAQVWDATVGEQSGDHVHRVDVPVDTRQSFARPGTDIAVSVPSSFLTDPSTIYPVTIDPGVSLGGGFDTFVQTGYSSDQSTAKKLKIGYSDDGGSWTTRSFIAWNTGFLAGRRVTGATLYLWETWAWSCNAAGWQVMTTGSVSTATRWTNQPGWNSGSGWPVASSTMTKGYDPCGSADGWVTANVTSLFQYAATHSISTLTTGIRATSEANHNGWKTFDSKEATHDPYVSLTYNSVPNAASYLTIGGKTCASGSARPAVATTTGYPNMQALVSDPDGTERAMSASFYLAELGQSLPATPTVTKTGVTAGSYATIPIPSGISLIEGTSYYWKVKVSDGLDTSGWSTSCEFTVDNGGPAQPPGITSGDYPACDTGVGGVCPASGGPGVTGTFTFDAAGVADVAGYVWWWKNGSGQTQVNASALGGSATVMLTPPATTSALHLDDLTVGGIRELDVMSVDQFGHSSSPTAYLFKLATAPGPVGSWAMNDGSAVTNLADDSGLGHTLSIHGGITTQASGSGDGGTAITLDGSTGYADRTAVVSTGNGFTVSAWAKLTSTAHSATIASQDGSHTSMFRLQYQAGQWRFAMTDTDATSAQGVALVEARSTSVPQLGVWTHLVGQYDPGAYASGATAPGVMRLYVDGVLEATTAFTTAGWAATGSFQVGRAKWNDTEDYYWAGDLDQVQAWNRVLDPREIGALSSALVGQWDLDYAGTDSAPNPHDLSASTSGVTWDGIGHNGADLGSAQLDGLTQALATDALNGPVVHTDQSFSVSAWVNLAATPALDTAETAVSQDGTYRSGFFLGARNDGGTLLWCFLMHAADVDNDYTADGACGQLTAQDVGTWVHLVGVFDAAAQHVQLYVNGQLVDTTARTTRWAASGAFAVGRGQWTDQGGIPGSVDFVNGNVDEVRAYAGALTNDMVLRLYNTLDGQL